MQNEKTHAGSPARILSKKGSIIGSKDSAVPADSVRVPSYPLTPAASHGGVAGGAKSQALAGRAPLKVTSSGLIGPMFVNAL